MTQSRLPWLRGVLTGACLVPTTEAGLVGSPPAPSASGSFELTLAGARAGRITGAAMFYLFAGEYGGGAPRIVLYDYHADDDFFIVQFQFTEARVPETGDFPLTADGSAGLMVAASAIRPDGSWALYDIHGTLTLTDAPPERLAGTFSFTDDSGSNGPVTVEGSFDAPRGSAEDIPQVVR